MNKSNSASNTVSIITLGCSKNVVDSENLMGHLDYNNITVTDNIADADTVIINTCGFIGPAKEESIGVIIEASELKKAGRINKLIVTGCLSERYSATMQPQLKYVDHFFGVTAYKQILKAIKPDAVFHETMHNKRLTPPHYSYVKISEGCNHECSFCAIPLIRGNYVSRSIESIEDEIKAMVGTGVKEFNIIAQDTTYYGRDLSGKSQLPELLDRISDIDGVNWIRLHYAYPTAFPFETLDIINRKSNICKYIDIPLQHFSDKILKSMKRGTNADYIDKLIGTIRDKIDNVAIRSTFIVGFPGETKQDFDILYKFIERQELDRVGVFTYSHEDGTSAFSMIDTVTKKEKERRNEELMLLQQDISLKHNKKKIGSTFQVLIDSIEDGTYIGRTQHDAPDVDNLVNFKSDSLQQPGDFVNVLIDRAEEYDLYGSVK